MFAKIETFLFDTFKALPRPAQVIVYFLLLGLIIYVSLKPHFINGQIIIKGKVGEVPYAGALLQTHIEGRCLKYTSNDDGYFSIPVVTYIPEKLSLNVLHMDSGEWIPIEVGIRDVWDSDLIKLECTEGAPYIRLAENHNGSSLIAYVKEIIGNPTCANAGVLDVPGYDASNIAPSNDGNGNNNGAPDAGTSMKDIVVNSICTVTGKNSNEISGNYPFKGEGAPTYFKRVEIIKLIEQRVGFSIPTEHWQYINDVSELTDYLSKRQYVQKKLDAEPATKNIKDWPSIQKNFPAEVRPRFKY